MNRIPLWADKQGPWETDRLTRALKRETGKRLGVTLHTQDYRHTAVSIGRVVVGESFSKGYQDEIGEVEEGEVDKGGEDIVELQNARTTAMGVENYGVPIDIIKHLNIRSIDAFRPLSTMWHRFLGLEGKGNAQEEAVWMGSNSASKTKKRKDRSCDDDSRDAQLVLRQQAPRVPDNQGEAVRDRCSRCLVKRR